MKALIVEDDDFKAKQIEEFLITLDRDLVVDHATSLQEATERLDNNTYDAVFLDMAIPSHSGDEGTSDVYSQPIGGLDILLYLSYDSRKEKVMILTQYPTIEYNREHVPLSKFKAMLERDDIRNLTAIALFEEDEIWKEKLSSFWDRVE